ncbi:hypothetical protein [Bradyrhizobium sp. CB3481]|uniref:hypothetical protein n=1 Tax=Bradyrhizobium sp. CB3481 TaxID=3039158 RepID=UPI0024B0B97C|nr:hypothetical protein [Bradyrhizobium sp. CB3481]WFU18694.1 hypothetical protein QA643_10300 [Bradyrhizobium sp. CB3481]
MDEMTRYLDQNSTTEPRTNPAGAGGDHVPRCINPWRQHREDAVQPDCRACPGFLLHAAALILLVVTERSLIGAGIFLLVWIMLSCLGLALVRRPTIVALISLDGC